jgi:shikimate dehydrogenase
MSQGTMIMGVAGRPVLHSLSPAIFRELFAAEGLRTEGPEAEAAYLRVAARSAGEALSLFRALRMRGMNLTAPFKEEAAALADELTPDAAALGAANCLVPLEGGRVLGANTDPRGVLRGLERLGLELAGRDCLVVGAGGAGKSAARALLSAGARVAVANRTLSRAEEVAALLGCSAARLEELPVLARGAAVVVSALAADGLPDPESWLPTLSDGAGPVVVDADYKKGSLVSAARARGLVVVDGTEWLLGQALPAYELFTGRPAPALRLESMAAAFDRSRLLASRRKIALVGLMGSGKTTAGRALARLTGLPFVDLDREIEEEAGLAVSAIFEREGESGFREREARMLDRITSAPGGAVVSTGGGAPTMPDSAAMLRERCLCAWLHVSPARAASRASAATRPLLAGKDPEATLAALAESRRGAYAACAHLVASSDERESREVAEVIHEEIDRAS